jgi:hypothetical protein
MKAGGQVRCGSVVLIATWSLTLTVGSDLSNESSDRELLQSEIGLLDLGRAALTYVLERTLLAADVPGGIAVVHGCEGERPHDFPPLGPTLRDGLVAIEKVAPDYEWRATDGVVNVAPASGFPPLVRTPVQQFHSKDTSTLSAAASLLIAQPDVREAMSRLGFREAPDEIEVGLSAVPKHGTPTAPTERPFAVRCRSCKVYDVLNALVRAKAHGVWVYEERRCGGIKTFRIAFSGLNYAGKPSC